MTESDLIFKLLVCQQSQVGEDQRSESLIRGFFSSIKVIHIELIVQITYHSYLIKYIHGWPTQ